MKAIIHHKYGNPEVVQLQELPKPLPKENEVLIKIHASTVNRTDCGFRQGKPYIVRFFSGLFTPNRKVLGSELAGVIEAVGKDVKTFKVGDAVFGLVDNDQFGTHAEYICMPEDYSIVLKPESLSFEEAASICDGAMLAFSYIKKMNIDSETNILINGTTGSIGSAGLQLAKHFGAKVTAICNTRNIELIKKLGADKIIDYKKEDFTKMGGSYDYVFDAVGKSSYAKCKPLLKPKGLYMSTELGDYWENPFLAIWTARSKGKKNIFPLPSFKKEDIQFFKELLESGSLVPIIDRVYPLEQIKEAYEYVELGEKTGNVVIKI